MRHGVGRELSLGWQRGRILCSHLDPFPELRIRFQPCRLHQNPSLHGPSREIKQARMGLREGFVGLLWSQADDKLVVMYANAHVAVEKKRDSTEHLLFHQAFAPAKRVANSCR